MRFKKNCVGGLRNHEASVWIGCLGSGFYFVRHLWHMASGRREGEEKESRHQGSICNFWSLADDVRAMNEDDGWDDGMGGSESIQAALFE